MTEFLRADYSDYAELCDEANRIFTEKNDGEYGYDNRYFQELLPKLYGDNSRMPEHYIAREDGKIVAEVGAFHCFIDVCGNIIENRGIGTVGVDCNCRRKGYMIKLMDMAAEDMQNEGVAFSALGGLRFRYEHFGYYPTGIAVHYSYGENCHKYLYGTDDSHGISFRIADKNSSEIHDIFVLYNDRKIHAVRDENRLYDILTSWKNRIVIIEKDGKFAGYAIESSGGNFFFEIELTDVKNLKDVVDALYLRNRNGVTFEFDSFDKEKNIILSNICESHSIVSSEQMRIFSHKKSIFAYLNAKANNYDLQNGHFAVNIADREKLMIEVENGKISVSDYNGKFDAELTEKEAALMFYGSYPILNKNIPAWFPLPMFVSSCDKV